MGFHGVAPWRRGMHAIFYAVGRGITPGRRLGIVHAIDVAPTVARLLGIDPPRDAIGRPIPLN
jgi:arylsulfatase A-like enzyme